MYKFSYLFLISCFVFISSCNTGNDDAGSMQADTTIVTEELQPLNPQDYEGFFNKLQWMVDYDSVRRKFVLVKNNPGHTDALTPEKIIAETNAVWANVVMKLDKISNDSIYISIPQSDYLTQSMGTTGLENYMASTTYSLTELAGIKYVHYSFGGSENIEPVTVSREEYKKLK